MNDAISPSELAEEGKLAYQRGDFLAAARAFQAAAAGYQAAGDPLSSAEMLNNSSVAYLRAGDGAAALQAVEGTPEIFAAGDDPRRQGIALGNLGAALEALHRSAEAVEKYQQSAHLLRLVGESEMYAQVMKSLSLLQLRMGDSLEAAASMQSALTGVETPAKKKGWLSRLLAFPSKTRDKDR